MSGAILDASRAALPDRSVEICIVGSGCGGATAAQVLAEAGHEVLVLEEGSDRTGRALTQRDAAMYDALYMDRGGRATDDLAISVMQGRALGGGGVINAADVVPIPDGVLAHWERRFGLGEMTRALGPYRERALADLRASRIDESQVNEANRLLRAGAQALGWRGEVMMHNRRNCGGLGTCLIGCPLDAKQGPRFVAIPAALSAGANFVLRARAVRIEGATQATKTVVCRVLDSAGHHERGEVRIRAQHVIVAASAVSSAQLLLRSGVGNEHVGQHLMLQPQLPLVARFAQPVRAFRGIPQSFAITEFEQEAHPEHGLWGFRIEAVMGTPGIVGSLLPFVGAKGPQMMAEYDHIAAALLLIPDAPSGRVSVLPSGRVRVDYTARPDLLERARAAVRAGAKAYLAAGAVEVLVPVVPPIVIRSLADLEKVDALDLRPATAPLLSAHQQGTLRFAASPRDGALDLGGRVHGTTGVYVFDSSGFPSSASSHTMTPILTVSRYLADRLVASLT